MSKRQLYSSTACILFLQLILAAGLPALAKDDWSPIPPEELALEDDPLNPGAAAVMLYRESFTNHPQDSETHHFRIKVLTDKGKEYANFEIPLVRGAERVTDLKARTVQPDGVSVLFDGEVFEKTVVKTGRFAILTKTFTLPAVEVGSIVEVKFTRRLSSFAFYTPPWIIQSELSHLKARFSIRAVKVGSLQLGYTPQGLPSGSDLQRQKDGTYVLELERIPAFITEEYIPPEATLKMYVRFYYVDSDQVKKATGSSEFWGNIGQFWYKETDKFIGNRKGIRRTVGELLAPSDTPEVQLRKLYSRVQQIRNLDFDQPNSEEEERREKLKENKNVEDVLKRGYGYYTEINQLFVALARAAGFEANLVYIAMRNDSFFQPDVWDPGQLSVNIVRVQLGSNIFFLDPGTPFTPFGLLSWEQTGVTGLLLKKDAGILVEIPEPISSEAVTERRATLRLARDGSLKGDGQVVFKGQSALTRRLSGWENDDAKRVEDLVDEMKVWFGSKAQIEIKSVSDWEVAENSLSVTFTINVPQFGVSAGVGCWYPWASFRSRGNTPSSIPSACTLCTLTIHGRKTTRLLLSFRKAMNWRLPR